MNIMAYFVYHHISLCMLCMKYNYVRLTLKSRYFRQHSECDTYEVSIVMLKLVLGRFQRRRLRQDQDAGAP